MSGSKVEKWHSCKIREVREHLANAHGAVLAVRLRVQVDGQRSDPSVSANAKMHRRKPIIELLLGFEPRRNSILVGVWRKTSSAVVEW